MLYVSHTGMTEPLGHSQVIPYVEGLARAGFSMEIVGFEPERATVDEIRTVEERLRAAGVGYFWSRRSASHAFSVEMAEATRALTRLLARALVRRPRIVHARSYLPAAVAHLAASLSPGTRFLFDVRGLLGEEYVDAGHWSTESYRYKLLKRVEKRLFSHADSVVVLTERHRRYLYEEARLVARETPIKVIPTCVDVAHTSLLLPRGARGGATSSVLAIASCSSTPARSAPGTARRKWSASTPRCDAGGRPTSCFTRTRPPIASTPQSRESASRVRKWRFGALMPSDMPAALAAADAAVSFIAPCFSKLGSAPTKTAEYLAIGLPTVLNRGIGDSDQLIDEVPAVIDAGGLAQGELEQAAERLAAADMSALRDSARRAAVDRFAIETVGLPRYIELYEGLVA